MNEQSMVTHRSTGASEIEASMLDVGTDLDGGRRILIVDGREVVRRGLADMMRDPGFAGCVTATASCLEDVVRCWTQFQPDVLIANADIPGLGDFLLARDRVALLVLISTLPSSHMCATLQRRANGLLAEGKLSVDRLKWALESLSRGQVVFDSELASHMFEGRLEGDMPLPLLTARELTVLDLMAVGMSNKEIARELKISTHGVKRHVANIMLKFNCSNRTMAVALAMSRGIVETGPPRLERSSIA